MLEMKLNLIKKFEEVVNRNLKATKIGMLKGNECIARVYGYYDCIKDSNLFNESEMKSLNETKLNFTSQVLELKRKEEVK